MTRNAYTLDGVDLTDPKRMYFANQDTGIRVLPARRSASLTFPGSSGESFSPGEAWDSGSIAIRMNVWGNDHEDFMENVEFVRGLFAQRSRLLPLVHHYKENGHKDRIAEVTFATSSDIKLLGDGAKSGILDFVGTLPKVFWRSVDTFTDVITLTSTTPVQTTLPQLSGGNAPLTDALIRIQGPTQGGSYGPAITDPVSGHTIRLQTITGGLSSSEYVIIDTAGWRSVKVSADTWDMNHATAQSYDFNIVMSRGVGPMLTFEPRKTFEKRGFEYAITVTPSWAGGALGAYPTKVEVRAQRSYL